MDERSSPAKANKMRVLVVDDELPVGKSISRALREAGYDVDMVLSGEEALHHLLQNRYQIMVLDLMMPGLSGMDVLTAVKEKDIDVSVIVVTGYPSSRTAVQSIKQGAFDYLPKPFTPRELQAVVEQALNRDRKREQADPEK